MQTDRIEIKNDGTGLTEALDMTTGFADKLKLGSKDALHLRLLGEELFGMVRAVTEDFSAQYWIEETGGVVTLIMETETAMDPDKKLSLVELSSSGKNEAAKGLFGKIYDIFEYVMFTPAGAEGFQLTQMQANSMMMGSYAGVVANNYVWSLERYRDQVKDAFSKSEAAEEWDELEKSVIANLADDVRVWVRGDKARLVIDKKTGKYEEDKKC